MKILSYQMNLIDEKKKLSISVYFVIILIFLII